MRGSAHSRRPPHIPVAVVSGLTVGIVSGILVLRSSGGARADGGVEPENEPEATEVAQVAAADAGADVREAVAGGGAADAAPPGAFDAGAADAGAAAPLADGEAGDEAAEPEPVVRTVELRFDVRPPDARGVRIMVDGTAVDGLVHSLEVEGSRPRVRVVVRARGFLSWSRYVPVGRDRELTVELERPEPTDDGPGGLIDL